MPDLIERPLYWRARTLARRARPWLSAPVRAARGSWRGLVGFLQFGRQLGIEGRAVILLTAGLAGLLEVMTEWARSTFADSGLLMKVSAAPIEASARSGAAVRDFL